MAGNYPYLAYANENDTQIGRQGFSSGGGGGMSGDMEARVAVVEAGISQIKTDLSDIKTDIRGLRTDGRDDVKGLRDQARTDFRVMFGALIAVALGLAGLMARGFGWL